MKKKIIILKNDRGGDLLNSIKSISSLLDNSNEVTIFLSPFNHGFSFLFKKFCWRNNRIMGKGNSYDEPK